jgi:hypothetical protein
MLAHFTGNMRKHIARAWQIDPKHRAWQHLCYRSFRHDLRFFCHATTISRIVFFSIAAPRTTTRQRSFYSLSRVVFPLLFVDLDEIIRCRFSQWILYLKMLSRLVVRFEGQVFSFH